MIATETIEPHVTHTTVPIHEVHHNAAQHHSASALPAVSMEEFKRQGGVLTGREERYDGFEGEPRSVGGATGSSGHGGALAGAVAGGAAGHHSGHTASGAAAGAALGNHESNRGTSETETGKPSMMDKLNPKKDADRDGKAGVMN